MLLAVLACGCLAKGIEVARLWDGISTRGRHLVPGPEALCPLGGGGSVTEPEESVA